MQIIDRNVIGLPEGHKVFKIGQIADNTYFVISTNSLSNKQFLTKENLKIYIGQTDQLNEVEINQVISFIEASLLIKIPTGEFFFPSPLHRLNFATFNEKPISIF